jgi:glyoxylate/hydroxypyruvate reductase A
MALLLCITQWDAGRWLERLRRLAPDRDIRAWPDVGDPAEISYAAVWKQPPGLLATFPNLKGIVSLGAGVDHVLTDPMLPRVPLGRVIDDSLTHRMSEWVVMHALMHLRNQAGYQALQRQKIWREIDPSPEARELRVGVMGLGVLGLDAVRKLAALGFDVAGWSRTPKQIEGMSTFAGDELDRFLARTDLLVSLLPLTAATRGILDRDLFGKLARDGVFGAPILMNAGRGGLQVEADIVSALDDGILRAATLDVFETEPLPPESPLWLHPKITISPHNSSISDENAVGRFVLRQVERHENGLSFEAPVDVARQY